MTVREAYRVLDLAPGLRRERVETQYQSLNIDLNNKLSQSKSPNIQTFYASRLKEIEVAKAILDQNFAAKEAKVSDGSIDAAIDEESADIPSIDREVINDQTSEPNALSGNDLGNEPKSPKENIYMFKNPFSFGGRIRRAEYGLSLLIWLSLRLFLELKFDLGPEALFFSIPLFWFSLAQGVKRCHDRGNSGWYQFIPFYVFWMLFADSEDGINEYGPNPKGIVN